VLTIVMYHYVRDDARVHARTIAELEAELDHVAERYIGVRLEDVVTGDWPEDACLLIGSELPTLLPGTMFEGGLVGRVVHHVLPDKTRSEVFFDAP